MKKRYPTALTIAGSDSGGRAGIQADLKAFSPLGVFGASAIDRYNLLPIVIVDPVTGATCGTRLTPLAIADILPGQGCPAVLKKGEHLQSAVFLNHNS